MDIYLRKKLPLPLEQDTDCTASQVGKYYIYDHFH